MLDIKYIRDNTDKIKETCKNKNINLDVDNLLELDKKRVDFQIRIEELRAKRNEISAQNKQFRPDAEQIQKGKEIKEEIQKLEEDSKSVNDEYFDLMSRVPLIPSSDTPIGKDDTENPEVKKWSREAGEGGEPEKKDFELKDHIELALNLNLLDLERGRKTAGFRGYYLKNELSFLHMAIMMYGLDLIYKKGFEAFIPPTIVKKDALFGSGHFPFDEENIYVIDSLKHTKEDDEVEGRDTKYLAGTAEPSILNYHRGEVLEEEKLPIKMAGFSQCYRSEVGGYGKDTRGLYRIHEFMKIEQVVFCKNDYEVSNKLQDEMISYSEELLQNLELSYRIVQVCTGDMGAGKYRMFDIETWMPSRGGYGETHSASNLGDWQSRRLNIKIKDKDGNKYFPHALNNTVVASPRVLIAVLENYQEKDGSIRIPKVLQKYMPGGLEVIKKK